jgi:diaminopimelate decarboxylase
VPLTRKAGAVIKSDVVGPVCESGDFFCKDRPLTKVGEGEFLALLSAGAYGFVMASNYNTPLNGGGGFGERKKGCRRSRTAARQRNQGE